jgi:hypothetical protein
LRDGGSPAAVIKALGLSQISDVSALEQIVNQIVEQNPKQVRFVVFAWLLRASAGCWAHTSRLTFTGSRINPSARAARRRISGTGVTKSRASSSARCV